MSRRFYEFIPGSLIWLTFVGAIILSVSKPIWAVYFIIVFDLLWLFRVLYFVVFLLMSWQRYRRTISVNWLAKTAVLPNWQRIYHLIFLPTYKEPLEVIRGTFESIVGTDYPKDKFIIVLAGDQRADDPRVAENFFKNAEVIKNEFGHIFKKILITMHPLGLPDEIPGKGSNINYAGHEAQKLIDEMGILYEDVIVSSFDIDTCVHRSYFAYLTYLYLTHPNPTRVSYQPVALYSNTIWDAPSPVRVAAFGTTFWLMTELARPERLFTFSSHSMSFKTLVDVGFWEKDIVTEDSRIFLQGFFKYNGDYSVVPMYLPVTMDTVYGVNYFRYLVALYKQQRRWAWGVEHFPYMMMRFKENKMIPLRKKIKYIWNHLEGMFTWATAPILIFILGWLPLSVASRAGGSSLLVQNAPFTLEWLMRLAMIGVFISALVSLTLVPRCPPHKHKFAWFIMLFQWALLPVTFIVFGAFPAIDAQTRLMLGKYLGFNVTAKKR